MQRLLIVFMSIIFSPALLGQLNKFSEPVKYNDFIVNEQIQIGKTIQAFTTALNSSADSTVIHSKRRDIISQANKAYKQLLHTDPYGGDTSFIKHAKALFSFYAKIASTDYKQFIDILYNTNATDEQISNKLKTLLDTITEKEKIFDANFLNAQKAFAKKYDIELTENEFKINQ